MDLKSVVILNNFLYSACLQYETFIDWWRKESPLWLNCSTISPFSRYDRKKNLQKFTFDNFQRIKQNKFNVFKRREFSIHLSRIPVNKGIKSRHGWTKYSDLYEIVHPSLVLISLCLLTGAECGKGTEKRATKNVQLVLQHCCKTSWKAMVRVLPLTFKPFNNVICCIKTGLMWVVKRATSLFNSFCSKVARQVVRFLLPVFPYLNSYEVIV